MYSGTKTSFAVSVTCLGLVITTFIPHAVHILHTQLSAKRRYNPIDEKRYEDEDGEATEESEAAFSQSDFALRLLLIALSFAGSVLAVASVIVSQSRSETAETGQFELQQWFQFVSWVCYPLSLWSGSCLRLCRL